MIATLPAAGLHAGGEHEGRATANADAGRRSSAVVGVGQGQRGSKGTVGAAGAGKGRLVAVGMHHVRGFLLAVVGNNEWGE
jgi:hypothetical protein